MKLVNTETNTEIKIGDSVRDFTGETLTVLGFREPHKPSSTGRVIVETSTGDVREFFPSVINAVITD